VSVGQANLLFIELLQVTGTMMKTYLLDLAVMHPKIAHILLLGDFNYPEIDYIHSRPNVKASENASSTRFMEKTQELCFYQHVSSHTRQAKLNLYYRLYLYRRGKSD